MTLPSETTVPCWAFLEIVILCDIFSTCLLWQDSLCHGPIMVTWSTIEYPLPRWLMTWYDIFHDNRMTRLCHFYDTGHHPPPTCVTDRPVSEWCMPPGWWSSASPASQVLGIFFWKIAEKKLKYVFSEKIVARKKNQGWHDFWYFSITSWKNR